MKILLINFSDISVPNIGLAYILTSISHSDHSPFLFDTCFYPKNKKLIQKIIRKIEKIQPDVIGFSTMSFYYPYSLSVAKGIKKHFKKIKMVWGGIHPTIFPKQVINNKLVDAVFIGEAEFSIVQYLNNLKSILEGNSIKITGVWYKGKEKIIKSDDPSTIEDLGSLPFINWDFWDLPRYFKQGIPTNTLPILSSRGCVRKCSYCSNEALMEATGRKKIRYRSVDKVIEEIKKMLTKYKKLGLESLTFEDEIFGFNKNHTIKLMNKLKSLNLNKKLPWACQTCADIIDKEIVNYFKKGGCYFVALGLESGVEKTRLKSLNKKITDQTFLAASNIIREAGLHLVILLLAGIPGESKSELKKSIKKAWKLNPSFLEINRFIPLPGTALYKLCKKKNFLPQFLIQEKSSLPPMEIMKRKDLNKVISKWHLYNLFQHFRSGIKKIGLVRFFYLFFTQILNNWSGRNKKKKFSLSGFFKILFLEIISIDGKQKVKSRK